MKDSLYHLILINVLFVVLFLINKFMNPLISAALIAMFMIYFREVTQIQIKNFDADFFHGWDIKKWSDSKNLETFFPIGIMLAETLVLALIFL